MRHRPEVTYPDCVVLIPALAGLGPYAGLRRGQKCVVMEQQHYRPWHAMHPRTHSAE